MTINATMFQRGCLILIMLARFAGVRSAEPRQEHSLLCGKCASRISHTTNYVRRAPQERAGDGAANQAHSEGIYVLCVS
jgi:hypothetical protein